MSRIEAYLNGLTTVRGRFRQINPDGAQTTGRFWISRPGRMRFEYDPPVPVTVMSDGSWLYEIDSDLKSVGQYPLSATPARFFLKEDISLADNVVAGAIERRKGTITVTLRDSERLDDGTIRLAFSELPLELKAWTVTDWRGKEIVVILHEAQFGVSIAPELFEFIHPFPEPENGN